MNKSIPIIMTFLIILSFNVTLKTIEKGGPYSIYDSSNEGLSWLKDKGLVGSTLTFFKLGNPKIKCNSGQKYILILFNRTIDIEKYNKCKFIIASDNSTTLSKQLNKFNIKNIIVESKIVDPIFNHEGDPTRPLAWLEVNGSQYEIATRYPDKIFILYNNSINFQTSPLSFEDRNDNLAYDSGENRGPFNVGACTGNLCYIADIDFLTNSDYTNGTFKFIKDFLGENVTLVYSDSPSIEHSLYYVLSRKSIYYLLFSIFLSFLYLFYRIFSLNIFLIPIRDPNFIVLFLINLTIIIYNFAFNKYLLILVIVPLIFEINTLPLASMILAAFSGNLLSFIYSLISIYFIYKIYTNHYESYPYMTTMKILEGYSIAGLPLVLSFKLSTSVLLALAGLIVHVIGARVYLETVRVIIPNKLRIPVGSTKSIKIKIDKRNINYECLNLKYFGIIQAKQKGKCNIIVRPKTVGADRLEVVILVWDKYGLAARNIIETIHVESTTRSWLEWKKFARQHPEVAHSIAANLSETLRGLGLKGRQEGSAEGSGEGGIPGKGSGILVEESLSLLSTQSSVIGDYYGVRYYVPGDSLKLIHWKKSVSTGRIVVRQYSSPQAGGGGSGADNIFIVLLDFYMYTEYDKIILKIIDLLAGMAVVGNIRVALLLVYPDGTTSYHVGSPDEIAGILLYVVNQLEFVRVQDIVADIPTVKTPSGYSDEAKLLSISHKMFSYISYNIIGIVAKDIQPHTLILLAGGSTTRPALTAITRALDAYGIRWTLIG